MGTLNFLSHIPVLNTRIHAASKRIHPVVHEKHFISRYFIKQCDARFFIIKTFTSSNGTEHLQLLPHTDVCLQKTLYIRCIDKPLSCSINQLLPISLSQFDLIAACEVRYMM